MAPAEEEPIVSVLARINSSPGFWALPIRKPKLPEAWLVAYRLMGVPAVSGARVTVEVLTGIVPPPVVSKNPTKEVC